MQNIYKYLKSAIEGEKKTEKRHDMDVFKKSEYLASKYNIHYDGISFIPDEEMADSVFEAGIELLHTIGVYCTSTNRVIKIDEEDILKALNTSNSLEIGNLKERLVIPHRYPTSPTPPVIIGGPSGGLVSEENLLYLILSAAMENSIQGIYSGAMKQLAGEYIKPKSPLEMIATIKAARTEREAIKIAGREGLALMGPSTPTLISSYLLVSSDELYSKNDPQEVYQLDELKTDYDTFSKCIFHSEHGNHYITGQCPVFGGNSIGSPEGLAIIDVAETIQSKILTHSSIHGCGAVHANTGSSSAKEVMWACNLASLGISRNMNFYTAKYYWNCAGCGSEMMFYETAAQAIGDTVCGRDILMGPVGNSGKSADQSSGLESRFMAEMANMATHLDYDEANRLISKIYSKYVDKLKNPTVGKPFDKLYVINSEYDLYPTEQYLNTYRNVTFEIYKYLP